MAHYFKSGKLLNFFDPVSRINIQPHKPAKVEEIPTSSYFREAMKHQNIIKCSEEEYNTILGIVPGEAVKATPKPEPVKTRIAALLEKTKKEILKEFDWMDPSDLTAGKKKSKEDMITYFLKIEPDYED